MKQQKTKTGEKEKMTNKKMITSKDLKRMNDEEYRNSLKGIAKQIEDYCNANSEDEGGKWEMSQLRRKVSTLVKYSDFGRKKFESEFLYDEWYDEFMTDKFDGVMKDIVKSSNKLLGRYGTVSMKRDPKDLETQAEKVVFTYTPKK